MSQGGNRKKVREEVAFLGHGIEKKRGGDPFCVRLGISRYFSHFSFSQGGKRSLRGKRNTNKGGKLTSGMVEGAFNSGDG